MVDGFSSRSVLNGRSVTFHKDKDQDFTTVDFEVNIPKEAIMPISGEGIAKITIYSLDKKSENRKEKYTIDNLLQMWGTVPESEGEKKSD